MEIIWSSPDGILPKMALKRVKGNIERMFDKNLTDLVRGIRNNKDNEARYIAQCVEEIKQELRQENIAVKANAVAKLTYLQMLGYDISWAAFNIIEVMSSPKFTYKRIGYLSASQCFHEGTEVLMLTTNMIRKDLNSQNQYDAGTALTGLACFITSDLARDLANDILTLLTSTKPYLRKKAVLILYKVFLKFPEALRPAFPRLKEKLEDPDPGVQSAAVNVVCELARKNPKNYLSLAPVFFKLMTSSTNNWMLIKIIKLFAALTPLEPRLGKKLIEPLTNLIHSTSAMSLLYECINTVIAVLISISSGMPNHSASIQLCVQKLRILIEDSDQNLKYLGLLAMSKILKTHPKSVQAHKDLVLQCLDDKDESIRLRALDLLYGMVSKKNLMEIVKKLMIHMDKAEGTTYRDELLSKIIEICCQNNYQFVTNFEWYISVLVELTRIEGTKHGHLIASQMLDVAIRVQAIRPFAVSQMAILLENAHLLTGTAQRHSICEVLYAAAWICGEFSEHVKDPKTTLEAMLRSKVTSLPGHIQSVYVQNIAKLYSRVLTRAEIESDEETPRNTGQLILDRMPIFIQSADLEVQERACCILQLTKYIVKLITKGDKISSDVALLFSGELNPVAPKAQKKVPVPEGLDLDKWINNPPSESSEEEDGTFELFFPQEKEKGRIIGKENNKKYEPSEDELKLRREARRQEQANNPHYLKSYPSKYDQHHVDNESVDDIPVATIDLSIPLHIPEDKRKKKRKQHNKRKKAFLPSESDESEEVPAVHVVNTDIGEMPEGAKSTDDEGVLEEDPHRALDINLEEPLRDDEVLTKRMHHITEIPEPSQKHAKLKEKKSKPKKEKKDKEKKHHKKKEKVGKMNEKDKRKESQKNGFVTEEKNDSKKKSSQKHETTSQLTIVENNAAKENEETKNMDDIDFWLTPSQPLQPKEKQNEQDQPIISSTAVDKSGSEKPIANDKAVEKSHKKKEKKTKKEKKEKRPAEKVKDKSEYEEALGISTPSKEQLVPVAQTPATPSSMPVSCYQLLAEDKNLRMMYETRTIPGSTQQIVLSVVFTNTCSSLIKELDFNVLDTAYVQLNRASGDTSHCGLKVPFQLQPGAGNEGQFALNVHNVTVPQKLRGTLTYMVVMDDGSTHEKLDFKLPLPCSSYMIGSLYRRDTFTELLGSGDLAHKDCVVIENLDADFSQLLARTCYYLHFCVVEQVEQTASLYSRSIQDHHVCLLMKSMPNDRLSIDGKSTDLQLLCNILEEIKLLLKPSSMPP